MTYIYALYKDGIPFYVGQTKNLNQRFGVHKRRFGKDITIKKLDSIPSFEAKDWKPYEVAWVSFYKVWEEATLVNLNEGGNGRKAFRTEEQYNKYQREWKQNNKHKVDKAKKAEYDKQRNLANPKAKVQRDKDYYEKNKAIIRAKQAIYYLNNKHSNNGN